MEKLTLSDVTTEIEIAEHNGLVRTLANIYRAMDKKLETLYEQIDKIQSLQDELVELANDPTNEEVVNLNDRWNTCNWGSLVVGGHTTVIQGGKITADSININRSN